MPSRMIHLRSGVTILEVSVATALAALLFVAAAQFMTIYSAHRRELDRETIAYNEAANILEQIRLQSWDDLNTDALSEFTLGESAQRSLPNPELSITVEPNEAQTEKHIQVRLLWGPDDDRRRHVSLSSWRFQPEHES